MSFEWLRHLGLIVLNDLADTPYNACFKVFASRMNRKQKAIDLVVQQIMPALPAKLGFIFTALFNLWKHTETGGDAMKTNITPKYAYQGGNKFFEDYMASLPLEERLKGLAPEDRLKGLNPEERLKGLDPQVIEAWLEKMRAAN